MKHVLQCLGIAVALATIGCGNEMTTSDAATAGSDAPVTCTDISGVYTSSFVGCDELGIASTDVTIDLDGSCGATFTSVGNKTLPPINGEVTLRADGSFGPTDLMIGNDPRSCTGATSGGAYEVTCGTCVMTLSPPT